MKRGREEPLTAPADPEVPTGPQRLVERGLHDTVVLSSPYGRRRARLGWGSLFQPPLPATVPGYPSIHIGISSLNGVPGKADRSMRTLLRQYRRKFNTLEHCYPYHKVDEQQAWETWAEMAREERPSHPPSTALPPSTVGTAESTVVDADAGRFQYTIKANNFLTHTKQLAMEEEVLAHVDVFFRQRCAALGDCLGPILLQLPPSFQRCPTNLARLTALDARLPKEVRRLWETDWAAGSAAATSSTDPTTSSPSASTPALPCGHLREQRSIRIAVEFRHRSWFHAETFELLRELGWALVVAHHHDDPTFAVPVDTGVPYLYIRLHGPLGRNVGDYGPHRMDVWAEQIARFVSPVSAESTAAPREVYVFLNNSDSHVNGTTSSTVDATYLAERLGQLLLSPIAPCSALSRRWGTPPLPAAAAAAVATSPSQNGTEAHRISQQQPLPSPTQADLSPPVRGGEQDDVVEVEGATGSPRNGSSKEEEIVLD